MEQIQEIFESPITNSSNKTTLTDNAIAKLLNLTKIPNEPNYFLQVIQSKVTAGKQNGNIYTATLSDGKNKFDRFFLPEKHGCPIKDGDVIAIKNVQKCVSNNKPFFKVMKFEVLDHDDEVIGDPVQVEGNIVLNGSDSLNGSAVKTKDIEVVVNKKEESNRIIYKEPTKSFHYKLLQLSTFTKDLCILVRCMSKTEKRTYKTSKGGNCTVFNFIVMDSENTEMQISCFGKIADNFSLIVQEGMMYEIIGGYVKLNDHKYNSTKADYQINLNEDSKINQIEDSGDICDINPTLTSLNSLNELKIYQYIDFIALVIQANDKTIVKTKKGEMSIKKLVVVDDSEYKVEFTLWKDLSNLDIKAGDIIFVKKAKVGEYSGRNISASDDSQITINPTFKSLSRKVSILKDLLGQVNGGKVEETKVEEHENRGLKNFKSYQNEKIQQAKTLYECKISNLKDAYNDPLEKTHKIKVYVTQFKHSEKNYYAGCPTCKKKLIEANNIFKCNSCSVDVATPLYNYTISFRVKDCTSDQFIECYGSTAEKILNMKAEEYKTAFANNDEIVLKQMCANVEFKQFIMVVKSKTQVYNNISKKKIHVISIEKIDLKSEMGRMIKFIELGMS